MDVEKFLIENLIDSYYKYSEVVEQKSAEEIDELYVNSEGEELSDKEFLLEYYDDVFTDEIVDSLYATIVDFSEANEIDINKVVAFLASKYYVINYFSDKNVINYLKCSRLEEIAQLFKENYYFGMAMVRSFFESLKNEDKYTQNREEIFIKEDQDKLLEFENVNQYIKIRTLNNMLRDIVCNLYNHYIANGCDDIESLNNTWMYFFADHDPLNELESLGIDARSKMFLKSYLLSIIYADIYEDVCNKSIIDSQNEEDRIADIIPFTCLTIGALGVAGEADIRNRLLKHFILLQDDEKKMQANREKTYKDNRVKELKRFNPFYKLDEIRFK